MQKHISINHIFTHHLNFCTRLYLLFAQITKVIVLNMPSETIQMYPTHAQYTYISTI